MDSWYIYFGRIYNSEWLGLSTNGSFEKIAYQLLQQKVINATLDAELIKPTDTEHPRAGYLPAWA